jgi:hypothetical protein
MELQGWQQLQFPSHQNNSYKKVDPCTVGSVNLVNLLPLSWDTFSAIYSQVLKLVSKFPYSKRLVLYFAFRGTTVKLDLGDGE